MDTTTPKPTSQRILSIDIVRGLTLLLMLFVNDLYMPGVPAWLGHTEMNFDGMGLADWVFPSFLFMVGISIPYAIEARRRRGASDLAITGHILWRTLSLICIGVALLNAGRINPEMTGITSQTWRWLFYLFLFMLWNNYPRESRYALLFKVLKAIGFIGIVVLLAIFRAGTPEDPQWLVASWWGILGLIGWGYVVAALTSLATRGSLIGAVVVWAVFLALNCISSAGINDWATSLRTILGTVLQGNTPMIVLTGLVTGTYLMRTSHDNRRKMWTMIVAGVVLIVAGFVLRNWYIISKILATPSWGLICNGISLLVLALVFYRTDICGRTRFTSLLSTTGRNSMTTYLAPSVLYSFIGLLPFRLLFYKQPDCALLAIAGSAAWAIAMAYFSILLERLYIKLKL
ncbi:MAG: DUF5009 domain-containing protein [Rikenellaceae bacterium]|nr:DUF5009 domain-containing protein [Rikenellaceae bacterium]